MQHVNDPAPGVIPFDEIMLWREQLNRAAERLLGGKLALRDAEYHPYTSEDMVRLLANHWFPSHYTSWKWGKQALERRNDPTNYLKAIANTSPLTCHINNRMALSNIIRAIAHGEFGRGIVFANNRWFHDTFPETAASEFGEHAEFVEWLRREWGEETVDFYLDALHSLAAHVPTWLSVDETSEDSLQRSVIERIAELQRQLITSRGNKEEVDKILETLQVL